ncbi:hypothetical protein BSKO_01682 [Bryopsis sp. KO-2023]|nr:hypothetical protein BSKO_01682 [Bryopsis sp. KO-2023]
MLLMGMNTSFTKNPMNPVTKKPAPVFMHTLENSFLSGFEHLYISLELFFAKSFKGLSTYSTTSTDAMVRLRFSSRGGERCTKVRSLVSI